MNLYTIGPFLCLSWMFAVADALAETEARSLKQDCPAVFQTYRDVLRCAENRAPDVQVSLTELARFNAEVAAATQWRNPELSADSVRGGSGDNRIVETNLSLGVPILLGGKLSARESIAQANVTRSQAKLFETKVKVRKETLLKLHRLRQLVHEQAIIDEAIETFTKLVRRLVNRPTLSPEQRLTKTVFQMSLSEYQVKRTATFEEMVSLDAYFQTAIGMRTDQLKAFLPEDVNQWPELENGYSSGRSPKIKTLRAEIEGSLAELDLAKSEAWPDLTVGPSVRLGSQGGRANPTLWGVSLSLPLPLFNANGAAKNAAAKAVSVSEVRRHYAAAEEEQARGALLKTYNELKRTLTEVLSHQEIESRHSEVESLFSRGIVPSALVIEAHRTFVELELTRNERELRALDAIYSIAEIDGTFLELEL